MKLQLKYNELIKYEGQYNSFGKMALSNKGSSPQYTFGSCNRYQRAKVYNKETEKELFGSCSPGPIYGYNCHTEQPSFSIPNSHRVINKSYDYYSRVDDKTQLDQADKFRRSRTPTIRFGASERFPVSQKTETIPPLYNPKLLDRSLKFSFGAKENVGVVGKLGTSRDVGPGKYKLNYSTLKADPCWTIPKSSRKERNPRYATIHETHFSVNSVGKQIQSNKMNQPSFSLGCRLERVCIMKNDFAQKSSRVRIG